MLTNSAIRTACVAVTALACLAAGPAFANDPKPDPGRQAGEDGTRTPFQTERSARGELTDFREALAAERGTSTPRAVAAEEAGAPVITSPSEGAVAAGSVAVSATSTAPHVRFTSGAWSTTVPVVDGVATTALDVFGRTGAQTLTAAPCDDLGCATTTSSVGFTVDNAAIAITQPGSGSTVGTSFVASVNAGGGAVRFLLDGGIVAQVTASPYQATIDTSGVAEGVHTLTAVQCDVALTECAGEAAPAVGITVQKALLPDVTSITPNVFSPNGDGRRDTTVVSYSLDTTQAVSWSVLDTSGSTLRGPVSLGSQSAGSHTLSYNGAMTGGGKLPTGGYILQLTTSKAVVGGTITGLSERTFQVDVTAPVVSSRAAVPATFFPVKDNYKDTTALRGVINENASLVQVEVFNPAGSKVRTISLGSRSAGTVQATWNGRTAGGTLLAAGTYRFRFVVRDIAGNQRVTDKTAVTLSHKKLVAITESKVVTPQGSYVSALIGYCSEIFASDEWTGGLEYLSFYDYDYYCDPETGDDLAVTRHRIVLPAAARYGSIRVSGYGHRDVPGYPDSAVIVYENSVGELSSAGGVMGPSEGWYAAQAVNGANYLDGRTFRWWAGTLDFNWYDIKSFRVTYTYYVLR